MLKYLLNLKLRFKLMAGFGLFAAIFMGIVTLIFTIKLYNTSVENQNEMLKNYADITSKNISAGLDFGDKASVISAYEAVKGSLEFIVVYDASGNVFSTYAKQAKDENAIIELLKDQLVSWKTLKKKYWVFNDMSMNCIIIPVLNSVGNEIGSLAIGASTATISEQLRNYIWFSGGLLVVAVGLGLLVAYMMSNFFVMPITKIVERMRDIAEGEGDLTKRIELESTDEIGELGAIFNAFVGKLHELIKQVASASQQIGSSVELISKSTSRVAEGAEKQSNQTTLVAVAAEEMSATIVQTSTNTSDAVGLSKEAQDAAQRGRMVVEDTVTGLQNISSVVSDSAQTLLELGKTVAQIGTVVEVINDIADQINLLSLNASIEAATAGEYGKGFAVVANEVKSLAEGTTHSTTEISQMIDKIQHAMANAIRAMERGTGEVEKGRELGAKTAEALNDILKANNQVMEMITNISVSAQEQSHTAEEISRNIENIANITKTTAQGVRQIDSTSEILVNQTSLLKTLVERFKLEGNHRPNDN
jgi:methyl-accepting chemotaxis protein